MNKSLRQATLIGFFVLFGWTVFYPEVEDRDKGEVGRSREKSTTIPMRGALAMGLGCFISGFISSKIFSSGSGQAQAKQAKSDNSDADEQQENKIAELLKEKDDFSNELASKSAELSKLSEKNKELTKKVVDLGGTLEVDETEPTEYDDLSPLDKDHTIFSDSIENLVDDKAPISEIPVVASKSTSGSVPTTSTPTVSAGTPPPGYGSTPTTATGSASTPIPSTPPPVSGSAPTTATGSASTPIPSTPPPVSGSAPTPPVSAGTPPPPPGPGMPVGWKKTGTPPPPPSSGMPVGSAAPKPKTASRSTPTASASPGFTKRRPLKKGASPLEKLLNTWGEDAEDFIDKNDTGYTKLKELLLKNGIEISDELSLKIRGRALKDGYFKSIGYTPAPASASTAAPTTVASGAPPFMTATTDHLRKRRKAMKGKGGSDSDSDW